MRKLTYFILTITLLFTPVIGQAITVCCSNISNLRENSDSLGLDSKIIINQVLQNQVTIDSLTYLSKKYRKEILDTRNEKARRRLINQVVQMEKSRDELRAKNDSLFTLIKAETEDAHVKMEAQELPKIIVTQEIEGIKVYQFVPANYNLDSFMASQNRRDTIIEIKPGKPKISKAFKILPSSPYDTYNPIPMDMKLPEKLFFSIQLGAFSNPVLPDAFRGVSPIRGESVENSNLIKYYAGIFYSSTEASEAVEEIKAYGFNDVFLVAYYNRDRIPMSQAKEIEFSENKENN